MAVKVEKFKKDVFIINVYIFLPTTIIIAVTDLVDKDL